MLSDKAKQALLDIQANAALARSFVAGLSFEQFAADRKAFYAVTRAAYAVMRSSFGEGSRST